jgi:hypothetical protein
MLFRAGPSVDCAWRYDVPVWLQRRVEHDFHRAVPLSEPDRLARITAAGEVDECLYVDLYKLLSASG